MSNLNVIPIKQQVSDRLSELAPTPVTLRETGLSSVYLSELIAKHIYESGILDLKELVKKTALEWNVCEEVLLQLRKEAITEVKGPADSSRTALSALRYSLTDKGRIFAKNALDKDGYIGYAPVPIDEYVKIVESQNVHSEIIDKTLLQKVFSDVVINQKLLDQLGTAINSKQAIFIYGPAGTGKSYLCGKLSQAFSSHVLIPHAIYQDGAVVQLYDPSLHDAIDYKEPDTDTVLKKTFDQRYKLCKRPVIMSGGELTLEQLEVKADYVTKEYHAPLQLKANNGIYLIDDLGRQKVEPKELFNRWIVPLEAQKDYLTVANGKRMEVPFDVVLIFSTNLNPLDLADDAFLRRIGHKVRFDYISEDEYASIWQQVCHEFNVDNDEAHMNYLMKQFYQRFDMPLVPCHPRDLIAMAINHEAYESGHRELTENGLRKAWQNYFINMKCADYEKSAYTIDFDID